VPLRGGFGDLHPCRRHAPEGSRPRRGRYLASAPAPTCG